MVYEKEDLRLVQLCEELILKEVDKICNYNGIQYFVGGGTAIGQRRHTGFIPWDDDIDINMSRDDYNRFIKIAPKELPGFLFLQNHNTDKNFSKLYSKVRLKDTKFVEYQYRKSNMEQGIYIDIFPMDPASPKKDYLKKMDREAGIYFSLYDYRINPASNQPMMTFNDRFKNIVKHLLHYCLSIFPRSFYSNLYYHFLEKNKVESDYIADFGTAGGKGFIIQKNIVYPVKRGKFDRIDVNIPYDIDAFLRRRYGEDYMKLPPVEQRVNHSPVELNFGSYTKNTVIDLLNK